ncbi:hypothetical protein [Phocaeicola vulgatus]|jgi:hypothetical protein|nr:hypothetical protein [Phocaeicola vulgatus]MCS2749085.1 hypothetical protein [Phocaeicola vulgatus]
MKELMSELKQNELYKIYGGEEKESYSRDENGNILLRIIVEII